MMNARAYTSVHSRARGWYDRLISLYPSSYLANHREELLQNFEDLEQEIGSGGVLWMFIAGDFLKSIIPQYMNYLMHHRWVQVAAVLVVALAAVAVWQIVTLRKAHSSFANYAAFRGCVAITSQSDTSGTCTLANGTSITLVQVDGRWYLDGDLPMCWGKFCF